ncbi:MAG: hypothetical protein E7012_02630 [Alphaproteobacteria bacterium]|nr:hypothetical protein [Alphaproteobacteria bacterium]
MSHKVKICIPIPVIVDFHAQCANLRYSAHHKVVHIIIRKEVITTRYITYTEKVYMAEMLQIIRAAGINVDLAL